MNVPTEREQQDEFIANVGRLFQKMLTITAVQHNRELLDEIEKAIEVVNGFSDTAGEAYAKALAKTGETPETIRAAAKADDRSAQESVRVLHKVLKSLRESDRSREFADALRSGPGPRERFTATVKPYDFGSKANLYNDHEPTSDQLEAFASQLRSLTTIP